MTRLVRSASVSPHSTCVFRVDVGGGGAHEIDSDNQLCLTPAAAFYLSSGPCIGCGRSRLRSAIALATGVARRTTGNGRTALHCGRNLGRIAGCRSSSINWWRAADHLRGGSSGLTYVRVDKVSVKGRQYNIIQ